ncbi:MAG: YihA family ribosome biogenesis GTP-binding protein [Chrysiogenetes bacterium]|nr:YihA family ribosome biogenesis GTP-binding protein [Chrysiogenetes bacterium]
MRKAPGAKGSRRWQDAEFILAASAPAHWPKHKAAEVAFAGRSNVGKSSLLNALVGRKALARVSGTPGRTRQIVFFELSAKLCLVDLPGYGYAKVSKSERNAWGKHINAYLQERENLALVIVLLDARHGASDLDKMLIDFLGECEIPIQIVFTKADKVPKTKLKAQIRRFAEDVLPGYAEHALAISSTTGDGIDQLRRRIEGVQSSE